MEASSKGLNATLEMRSVTVLAFVVFLAAAFGAVLPILADEAYYVAWSRRLDIGYFDHPPMVAWLLALTPDNPRFVALGMTTLSAVIWGDIGRRCGCNGWRWVPLLLLTTPLGFSGLVLVTPDIPLLFFYTCLVWCLIQPGWFFGAISLSACFWSKSVAFLLVPSMWLIIGPRRTLVMVGAACALYWPHLAWSAEHDWLPFSFQSSRQATGFHGVEFILGQIAIVTPWAIYRGWRERHAAHPDVLALVHWISYPTLLFWCLTSLAFKVEANWALLAWPPIFLVVAHTSSHNLKALVGYNITLLVILLTTVGLLNLYGDPLRGPERDGDRLAKCVEGVGLSPFSSRYQEQALLENAGVDTLYESLPSRRRSQYDLWPGAIKIPCDYVWFAPHTVDLQASCTGRYTQRMLCGGEVHVCRCEDGAKGGSRTPTP